MHLSIAKFPINFELDWHWPEISFSISNVFLLQTDSPLFWCPRGALTSICWGWGHSHQEHALFGATYFSKRPRVFRYLTSLLLSRTPATIWQPCYRPRQMKALHPEYCINNCSAPCDKQHVIIRCVRPFTWKTSAVGWTVPKGSICCGIKTLNDLACSEDYRTLVGFIRIFLGRFRLTLLIPFRWVIVVEILTKSFKVMP